MNNLLITVSETACLLDAQDALLFSKNHLVF